MAQRSSEVGLLRAVARFETVLLDIHPTYMRFVHPVGTGFGGEEDGIFDVNDSSSPILTPQSNVLVVPIDHWGDPGITPGDTVLISAADISVLVPVNPFLPIGSGALVMLP